MLSEIIIILSQSDSKVVSHQNTTPKAPDPTVATTDNILHKVYAIIEAKEFSPFELTTFYEPLKNQNDTLLEIHSSLPYHHKNILAT